MRVLDPSSHLQNTASANLGDLVIRDSIESLMGAKIPCEWVSYDERLRSGDIFFIGGANVLGPMEMGVRKIWRPSVWTLLSGRTNGIAIGCGWWSYEASPYTFSARCMKRYLSRVHPHSVRDRYTAKMLNKAGFLNVHVTGCPSMYGHRDIVADLRSSLPLITLTHYRANPVRDSYWLNLLLDRYDKIYFFVQGLQDIPYLESLVEKKDIEKKFTFIQTYDGLLDLMSRESKIFHVGTRLHANMLFLRRRLPSLCLDVDSRTAEMKYTYPALPIYSLLEFVNKIEDKDYTYHADKNFDCFFDAYIEYLVHSINF